MSEHGMPETTMEDNLRTTAAEFLGRTPGACFIGYEAAPQGGTRPVFLRSAGDAGRLVWNRWCYANLTAYLPEMNGGEGLIGIAVKGCDARALRELVRAGQIERARLFVVGLPCTGLSALDGDTLAGRCHGCMYPEDFVYDATLGPMETPDLPHRADVAVEENPAGKTVEERRRFWEAELDRCIRCEACRKICYACYCPECIFEKTDPRWSSRRRDHADKFFFHAVRAMHLAGRCIGCGECERACPAGVRLMLLNRSLQRDVEVLFGYRGAGVDENVAPPLTTVSRDDPEFTVERTSP